MKNKKVNISDIIKKNKILIIFMILLILLLISSIIFIQYKQSKKEEMAFQKKIDAKFYEDESKKEVIEYLKDKYGVTEVTYEKKERLLKLENYGDGMSSGAGLVKTGLYMYYYKFNYNGISAYAYVIQTDTGEGDKISDDYQYEKLLEYVSNEIKQLTQYDVSIIQDYLDPEELGYDHTNDFEGYRKAIIQIDGNSYDVIDKNFKNKYHDIYKKAKELDENTILFLNFKDGLMRCFDYGLLNSRSIYKSGDEIIERLDSDEMSFDGIKLDFSE